MTVSNEDMLNEPFARYERLMLIEQWYADSKLSAIVNGGKHMTLFMGHDAVFEEDIDVYPSAELIARIMLAIDALCPGDKVYATSTKMNDKFPNSKRLAAQHAHRKIDKRFIP